MKKAKQIMAIIGIILLIGMYLTTLVLAIVLPANAMNMLFASIAATVLIPIIIWIYTALYRWIVGSRKELSETNNNTITQFSESDETEDKTEGDLNQ